MKLSVLLTAALVSASLLAMQTSRAAVVLGQIDTFESGTTLNWANGGAGGTPPPLNINTGGPDGSGDNFLELSADGVSGGGRLTVFNRSQWIGDYVGQGITAIEMDLKNLGTTTLTIRIAFKATVAGGAPGYLSAGFTLAPDATWHHAVFQLTSASMVAIGSPAAFNTFFTNGEAEMRIINESGATDLNGVNVVGHLGVDNIQAVPEPEPPALLLVGGCAALFLRRLRRIAGPLSERDRRAGILSRPFIPRGILAFALLGLAAISPARASFHLWQIVEVYSDATGTVQFIELSVNSDGENFLSGRTLTSAGHTFTFGANVSARTANHHLLLATPGYIAQSGVPAADFNLGVNNFFDVTGDTLNYAGVNSLTFTAGQLPVDGVNSLNRAFNPATATTFTIAPMSPMNFGTTPTEPSAPKVKISGAKQITTGLAKIQIRGKATGVVTKVTYRVGAKASKPARGTSSWHFTAALKLGANTISVVARGPGGASKAAKITVTRR
jgi:hypothetical protein